MYVTPARSKCKRTRKLKHKVTGTCRQRTIEFKVRLTIYKYSNKKLTIQDISMKHT
jgi:hypothetical protein